MKINKSIIIITGLLILNVGMWGKVHAGEPVITQILPYYGLVSGGTEVTILGTNFVSGAMVTFGDVSASDIVFISSTEIRCISPRYFGDETVPPQFDLEPVHVRVINPDGQSASCYNCYYFEPLPPPVIFGVAPRTGPISGETIITITGANFFDGTEVFFGSLLANNITIISDRKIICRNPEFQSEIRVDVRVTNSNDLQDVCHECYRYASQRIEITPNQGMGSGGTEIIITGEDVYFAEDSVVTFGDIAAMDVEVISSQEIKCKAPVFSKVGAVDILVNSDFHRFVCEGCYSYTCIPDLERKALIDFYTSTNGPNWMDKTGWIGNECSECSWQGVICDEWESHVIALFLDSNNLTGSIPESISDLPYLYLFSVAYNSLTTPIPEQILSLPNLWEGLSDFRGNDLCPEDDKIIAFIEQIGGSFLETQSCYVPAGAFKAGESYAFERMWSKSQQPFYFNGPSDVAVDKDGNILVAGVNNHIHKFGPDGVFVRAWGIYGSEDGQFNDPKGIATDAAGNIFVADTRNNRIQKFLGPDGVFVRAWGIYGSEDGQFNDPKGIATDAAGNIFVADTGNDRIQKFGSYGAFITAWGTGGDGDGQFENPEGIATDAAGNIFVTDTHNHRIQRFTSGGEFLKTWGSEGSGDGQFYSPKGIATDMAGNIFVADTDNHRIQKFGPDGVFVTAWESHSSWDELNFISLQGITTDAAGNIFVADTGNDRIQKFGPDGVFVTDWEGYSSWDELNFISLQGIATDAAGNIFVADTGNDHIHKFGLDGAFITGWGTMGSGDGQFESPKGIATDMAGNIFVADTHNDRIQKFGSDGVFITVWGGRGSRGGQFKNPEGIATDAAGNIFVADTMNDRIQKFGPDGEFLKTWGSEGSGDGQFYSPRGIATDTSGNVLVADTGNDRIQKFSSDGVFITAWGSKGSGDGQFESPKGIATDTADNVFVADTGNNRIQIFTSDGKFMTEFGGLLDEPSDLCVGPDVRVYVADTDNHRIQVFRKVSMAGKRQKAIIVAGSGPGDWNNLWDATRMCADYAYGALLYQGFSKETVYYLSHDNESEYPSAEATNDNLKKAITDWGKDAEDLFIYMVGHGGEGTFRMGATELLYAADGPDSDDLGTWLDTIQGIIPGKVVLVYDACQSGSFLPLLTPPEGKERILAASASPNQQAVFATGGKTSFSFMFWAGMFNGDSFYNSYRDAKKSVALTYLQASQIEANGNGIPNEEEDRDIARLLVIGNEIKPAGDIPIIGKPSPSQTLNGETSALICVEDVTAADGISRVWAVIMPPGYSSDSPDIPVTTLPTVDLKSAGDNRYEATYTGFDTTGVYNIAIFANDRGTAISMPVQTYIIQTNGTKLKGDINGDAVMDLKDAMIALKVAAGADDPIPVRSDYVSSGIDLSGDGRIGIEEVVYVLQKVAGLR